MIDKHELRLGNLVKAVDYANAEIVMTIKELDEFTITIEEKNYGAIEYVNLLPLSLTEEWLKKLGERKMVMGDTRYYWQIGDVLFSETDDELSKGLHWLQNWYYFRTNKELEIQ